MPKKELEAKFNNLTRKWLKPKARKKLLSLCWRADTLKRIDEIVTLTGTSSTVTSSTGKGE